MRKSIIYCEIIVVILIMTTCLSSAEANADKKEDPTKDKDYDGVPDYLDDEKTYTNETVNNTINKTMQMFESSFSAGSWSFNYGSNADYGAWIEDVCWNNSYYIFKANVPWVMINTIKYELPGDFETEELGYVNLTNCYLIYQLYTKDIMGDSYSIEILWKFYKTSVNNAGKIDVKIQVSVFNVEVHTLFAPVRIDFDILGGSDDRHYVYGGLSGWHQQNKETYQFTYTPVDPIWGMKVKQQEYSNSNAWGGINAWSTSEKNYLLRYQNNEFKGDPVNYANGESTLREDDVLWTTAHTSGTSPIDCGPTLFVH